MAMFIVKTIKQVKKLMIAVIGFTVLAIGLALIVLPGPAILVIPAGLAILSIEFAWARNLLNRMRERLSKKKDADSKPNSTNIQKSKES
jgi:uncharacterized protein (TIGR02611 family)